MTRGLCLTNLDCIVVFLSHLSVSRGVSMNV